MIGQSFAIITVIFVMSMMFLRAGKRAGVLFALPLVSVPVFHLIGYALQALAIKAGFSPASLHITVDSCGFVIGLWLCFKLSRAINLRRLRIVYFISCVIYMGALAVVYINVHL